MQEKCKPVVVPYKHRVNKYINNIKSVKYHTSYMAYCGVCGNPINKYTSYKYCTFCRHDVDWSDTDHIPYRKFKLHEYAYKMTVDKI